MITIGEKLKEARIKKELTIDELQKRTKIQKRYLEALEDNDFDEMPGTYYVRAFIRQYADAVGLDGARMVRAYDGKSIILRSGEEEDAIRSSRKDLHREESSFENVKVRLPFVLLALVALSIIGIVVAMTIQDQKDNPIIQQNSNVTVEGGSSQSTTPTSKAETSSETTDSSEETTTSSSEKNKKNAINFLSESGSEVNMEIKKADKPLSLSFQGVNGPCWIGVMVDGVYVYEYTLQVGETQTTKLPETATKATIVLGASNNITLKVNNESFNFNPNQNTSVKKNVNLTIDYNS